MKKLLFFLLLLASCTKQAVTNPGPYFTLETTTGLAEINLTYEGDSSTNTLDQVWVSYEAGIVTDHFPISNRQAGKTYHYSLGANFISCSLMRGSFDTSGKASWVMITSVQR